MPVEETLNYRIEAHPETGLYDAQFGTWLFLASEIMLFGALFSSYILLRTGSLHWPNQHEFMDIPIGIMNTVILTSSSITMLVSSRSLKRNQFDRYRFYLGLTVALGMAFLTLKTYEYIDHIRHHLFPSTNVFMGLYYTMTGIHALHVIGGLIVNGYFWGPGSRLWSSNPKHLINRVEAAGLYWNFVDIVWLFILFTLYLI